jgi:uncharacterized protein (UPF0333 family)
MMSKKKGQSTLEYVIVFSVVIIAILAFAWTKLRPAVEKVLDKSATTITTKADTFNP